MPFARRNDLGKLASLHIEPEGPAREYLAHDHPEVRAFLGLPPTPHHASLPDEFGVLDQEIARVVEDLVAVLLKRSLIELTDFPVEARQKLERRAALRASLCEAQARIGFVDTLDATNFGFLR